MTTPAHEEGRRAAAEGIPADANPYDEGTDQRTQWANGHACIASEIEASQSEDT